MIEPEVRDGKVLMQPVCRTPALQKFSCNGEFSCFSPLMPYAVERGDISGFNPEMPLFSFM